MSRNLTGPTLRIKRVAYSPELRCPAYHTVGASAFDLQTAEDVGLPAYTSGEPRIVGCGFAFEIPEGFVGVVVGRSKLSRDGVHVYPGIIDSDYRGEVKIMMLNLTDGHFYFDAGARVAQMLIQPAPQFTLTEVDSLSPTSRGASGFGHTGD